MPALLLRPTKEDENDDEDEDKDGTEPKTKTNTKSSTSIGLHLLDNVECLERYHLSMVQIVHRARCESILHILELLYIKLIWNRICVNSCSSSTLSPCLQVSKILLIIIIMYVEFS